MTKLGEFWQENNGRYSNTRLHATILIGTGCGLLVGALVAGKLDGTILAAGGMLITQSNVTQKNHVRFTDDCQI